ncbi:protein kinase domain-containing protein [Polyangium aurulentum]|uniref:nSTAND1 domain-containing NTPase n=1 Tax=Polyangium aurulentum TaxID=2567896 RepID=UPI00200F40BD|nr:protein kinase [Polyangium aurulentum]UQA56986.1 protein kinase [Polyangium aurulentum]
MEIPKGGALATTCDAGPGAVSLKLEPGTVHKHYELIRQLGAGGMGVVFLARDIRLGRLVAIKFLLDRTGTAAERFLGEARATALCRHDNIVVIHDVDEVDGSPYMVLEYIQGRTLRAAMAERAHDTAAVAIEVMLPVARALACAHEMGLIHRDLKPENILLGDDGAVKVVDFGIAKQVSMAQAAALPDARAIHREDTALTQDGALVGTMPYMSPEQWLEEPLDARSDIWAAGIILFEISTGAHPLEPPSLARLVEVMDLEAPMPSVRERRPDLGLLADVIDRCLKKRKEERMGSARELAEALEGIGADKGPLALAEDEGPFAGLSAFQEADAARFFGRDNDIAAVIGRLRNQQLIMIAGPSGAGKSSFVRAGVIPALKRAWREAEAFVVRPGPRPLAALADVLAHLADTVDAPGEADPEAIAGTLRSQPGYLGARLRSRCRKRGGDHRILLFVDQLEELYTLGSGPEERAAFCACLEGVGDDASSPLRVVLSMRGDFLDRLAEERRFSAEVTRGLFLLPPMTHDGLRAALVKPLEAARYAFEDDALVGEMLGGLQGTGSPLPLLQFTAMKLWEERDRERRLLTREAYVALGGVAGALSTHADAVLSGMAPSAQRLTRAIFTRLVTPERTRAIVRLDELVALSDDAAAVEGVVQHLAEARLLAIESGGEREGRTVELVHESLIDRWAKLRQWLDADEQDAQFLVELRNAAQQWEKNGRADDFLWRDRAALEAGQWLERRKAEDMRGLGKRERGYLEAVVRLAQRMRRRRRRMVGALFTGLGVVTLVILVLLFRANGEAARAEAEKAEAQAQRGEALAQRTRAEQSAVRARNATRMAAARERQGDPTTMLALLREVEPPEVPRGWSELTRSALDVGVAGAVLNHPDVVDTAAWSPDGKRIVTASRDKTARVWSADGMGDPRVLRGHQDAIFSIAWSPDGKRIVTASQDKTVRVWSADGMGDPLVLRGHEKAVYQVAWSPDGKRIVTASLDKTARVWGADGTGDPLVLRGHEEAVRQVAWSPDGKRIVTASWDKTARVWSADGTGAPRVLRGHEQPVRQVAWSPDGKRIVTASWDKTARVWSADGTGDPRVLRGHERELNSLAWSPDGKRIVTASLDKTARVWSADGTGDPRVLRGHEDTVRWVAWSPDGKRIVTASLDKTARVWSADGTGDPRVLRGHESLVYSAAWSPDGKRIVTASEDKTARVWSANFDPLVLRGHEGSVHSAAWNPDDKHIVTASKDKTARVWSADGTGDPRVLRGHEDMILSTAWSPDGKHIVTASEDKTARVWDADGTGDPRVLRGHEQAVSSAAWSPDGKRIVTASKDKTARVWGADGTGDPRVLRGHEREVHSAAWSPDGKRIVTASEDRTARVWSADGTGAPRVLRGHEDTVRWVAWSPDGKRIVTASWDKTVRVWSADGTGDPRVLRGHDEGVNSAAWSPDGKRIVTASQDKTVRVWNADNAEMLLVFRGDDAFNHAAFGPDGKRIVAVSDDKTVSVWSDVEPLHSAEDLRLWTATSYCMPIEHRIEILDVPEATARNDQKDCLHRVEEAGARPGR